MDPSKASVLLLLSSNLRSRGDGPALTRVCSGTASKPPLTRRWTLVRGADIHRVAQTSAHAEMDLNPNKDKEYSSANLRSRGDGPALIACLRRMGYKPPLTRRWTHGCCSFHRVNGQTSAHAEMDRTVSSAISTPPSNLRSRGDGPTAVHAFAILANKPPLTRRWTYANATVDCSTLQTSAHAEMDRILISCMKRVVANLRSRGDGPGSC